MQIRCWWIWVIQSESTMITGIMHDLAPSKGEKCCYQWLPRYLRSLYEIIVSVIDICYRTILSTINNSWKSLHFWFLFICIITWHCKRTKWYMLQPFTWLCCANWACNLYIMNSIARYSSYVVLCSFECSISSGTRRSKMQHNRYATFSILHC